MAEIDEKIVSIKFNNENFKSRVDETIKSLDSLKSSMKFDKVGQALSEVQNIASNFKMELPTNPLTEFGQKFIDLRAIVSHALGGILGDVTTKLAATASQFTTGPIKDGFAEYEKQLDSIQTILGNTQSKGENIETVSAALDELNTYADKTIYNFASMTSNIGMFTAAGVGLKDSVSAIKGISNLAALSGSTSQQASTAMYQLSQAISSGTVKLMDWNSVVNAGMGGEAFQEALKRTARLHGIAVDDIIAKQGSFRESLSEGWLSAEVMLETLSTLTNDLSKDQLLQMGYTEEQAQEIMALAETANDSATKVKTFTGLMDTLKESLGSGWAETWKLLIGDFEEARTMWTNVAQTVGGVFDKMAEKRNNFLRDFKNWGGRDAAIDGLLNIVKALAKPIEAIGKAFANVFTGPTADGAVKIARNFDEWTAKLIISDKAAGKITTTFEAIFNTVKLVGTSISQTFKLIAPVVGLVVKAIAGGVGGIGTLVAAIAPVVSSVTKWLTDLKLGDKVLNGISAAGEKLAPVFNSAKSAVEGFVKTNFSGWADEVKEKAGQVGSRISEMIGPELMGYIDDFKHKLEDARHAVVEFVRSLAEKISRDGIVDALRSARDRMGEFAQGVYDGVIPVTRTLKDRFRDAGHAINEFVRALIGGQAFDAMKAKLQELGTTVGDFLVSRFGEAGERVKTVAGQIGSYLSGIPAAIKGFFSEDTLKQYNISVSSLQQSMTSLADTVHTKVGGAFSAMKTTLGGWIDTIPFEEIKAKLVEFGSAVASAAVAVKTALAEKLGAFYDAVSERAKVAWEGILEFLVLSASKGGEVLTFWKSKWDKFVLPVTKLFKFNTVLTKTNEAIHAVADGLRAFGDWWRTNMSPLIDRAKTALGNFLRPAIDQVKEFIDKYGLLKTIMTAGGGAGVIAALIPLLKAQKDLKSMRESLTGALDGIKDAFGSLGDYFDTLSKQVKINSILKIAAALGILAASMWLIAQVPAERLVASSVAMGVLFAGLKVLINDISGMEANAGMVVAAGTMIAIAVALGLAGKAVAQLGELSTESVIKGTASAVAIMTAMGIIVNRIGAHGKITAKGESFNTVSALQFVFIAASLKIAASAIEDLGTMDLASLGKGISAALLTLAGMALIQTKVASADKLGKTSGVNMLILALTLKAMAHNIEEFAAMPWGTYLEGMFKMGLVLAAMTASLALVGPKSFADAAALLALVFSLRASVGVIQSFAELPWDTYLQGVSKMALTLAVLAGAMKLMNGKDISGAAGLATVSIALATLIPVIQSLGNTPIEVISVGLIALAAALGILIGAAFLAQKVGAGLFLLAGAILAIGLAVGIASAGIGLLAVGLTMLAAAGLGAVGVIIGTIMGIATTIPFVAAKVAEGFVVILSILAQNGETIKAFLTMLLQAILDSISNAIPNLENLIQKLLTSLLNILRKGIPDIVACAWDIMIALLNGIKDRIPDVVNAGVDIMIAFMDGLGERANDLIDAAGRLVLNVLNGIRQGIEKYSEDIRQACIGIGKAIVDGMTGGLTSKFEGFKTKLGDLVNTIPDKVRSLLGIHSPSKAMYDIFKWLFPGATKALDATAPQMIRSVESTVGSVTSAISEAVDAAFDEIDFSDWDFDVHVGMDISGIESGAARAASLLDLNATRAQAHGADPTYQRHAAQAQATQQPTQVQFIQNNHSPKALDPIEIYRQTNTQIGRIARAIR